MNTKQNTINKMTSLHNIIQRLSKLSEKDWEKISQNKYLEDLFIDLQECEYLYHENKK